MNILNKVLSKIPIKKKVKKPSLIKEIRDKPEEFILEAFIENDEIIMKIKRKGVLIRTSFLFPRNLHVVL